MSFNGAIMQHALDNWPASDMENRRAGKTGPYYYNESVYKGLGL